MGQPKVAIITITDGCNYGNRLQNYALQTALEKSGAKVETFKRKNYHDAIGLKLKIICKTFIKIIVGKDMDAAKRNRKRNFREFNSRYIHFSKYTLQKNRAPKHLATYYNAFFVGSDQVWNPSFRLIREDMDNYFASFAPKDKKFSYAASFGISEIPDQYTDYYCEKLSSFCRISVREDHGVGIVRSLSGKTAESVCDPTLLLDTAQWDAIMEKPSWVTQSRYVVTYFLGEISEDIHQSIKTYTKQQNLKVISLQSEFIKGRDITDRNSFAASPQQFLWLIAHSECVLTDSFHACVFSILYRRPFQVFSRKAFEENNKMGSRLESLLSKFELQNRMCEGELIKNLLTEPLDDDTIERVLSMEQEKGYSFIQECLELLL